MVYPEGMHLSPEDGSIPPENPHKAFLKQHNLAKINEVLSGGKTAKELADEITKTQLELEEQRDHDPLTGLFNLYGFTENLMGDLTIVQQHDIPTYLGFFDGDKLKEINDTRGKLAGNKVIQSYATALRQITDQYPNLSFLMGRFGGDEFMLLVIGAGQDKANKVFEDLRSNIPEIVKKELADPNLNSTVSIGVVMVQPNDNAQTLINRADDQLKKAKETRNKVVFENQPPTLTHK